MKISRRVLYLLVFLFLFLFADAVSAQQIVPAAGSLDSPEEGLWNYYSGRSRAAVKKNAPMYEKIPNSNSYLLDHQEVRGVNFFLTGEFTNNRLSLLQIMIPFPEYKSCNKDTKEISKKYAELSYAMMGVEFNSKKECSQSDGTMICKKEDYSCVYRLCPDKNFALACTLLDK